MLTSFDQLDTSSKVWVYQSTSELTTDQTVTIKELLTDFVTQWNSHGADVTGAFDLLYDRFIILAADDRNSVSGCSIDSSVSVIREIETKLNLSLLTLK